ncbi:MAG: GNAT family N-acetyltransferase, partial [Candidatus Sericytochromatia bacterium]
TEKDGLYRLTALKILEDAIEKGYIVHQSSGVSKFKMHRGAEPSIEYMMVYYSHLSKRQQQPWKFFNKLSDKVVIPIMKKYKL